MFKHFLWGEVRGINRIDHGSPPGQVRPLHHPTIISQAYLQLPPSSWLRRQRLAHDPKKNNNYQEKKLTKTPRNKDKRHTACLVLKTKTKREKRNEDKKRDKKTQGEKQTRFSRKILVLPGLKSRNSGNKYHLFWWWMHLGFIFLEGVGVSVG